VIEAEAGSVAGTGRGDVRCPVVHFEIAPEREVGYYWAQGQRLREAGPILFNTLSQGFWVLTSYDLVREMYQDSETFSAEVITAWNPEPHPRMIPMNIDPPEHVHYRGLLNAWFSPAAVRKNREDHRAICRRYVEAIAPLGQADAVADFAIRYPTEVFLKFAGLPTGDTGQLVRWVDDFFFGYSGARPELAVSGAAGIKDYYRANLHRRGRSSDRGASDGDLIAHLLASEIDPEQTGRLRALTEDEVVDMCFFLTIAGLDTTRSQLGWLLYHLATHPDDRHRLLDEPALAENAVEESLRFHGQVYGDGRKVTRDVEFHGCPMRKGDMVFGMTSVANRSARFDRPDEFVIDRKPSAHLAFAAGPHRCAGSHLARQELRIALEEWHRLIPEYELAACSSALTERGAQLSLTSLPLTWSPA
jgi:cytochrome P450